MLLAIKMKKKLHNVDQTHAEPNQLPVLHRKKLFNIQVLAPQHRLHQRLQIQALTSSVKKKVFGQIHATASKLKFIFHHLAMIFGHILYDVCFFQGNTSGVWTVAHRIWVLWHINSLAHLVWCSIKKPIHATILGMLSAQNQKPQLKGNCFSLGYTFSTHR